MATMTGLGPRTNWQQGFGNLGQQIGQAVTAIGQAPSLNFQEKQQREAYELLKQKTQNFQELKSDLNAEISSLMAKKGYPDNAIKMAQMQLSNASEPNELIEKSKSFVEALQYQEQNDLPSLPSFGEAFDTYKKEADSLLGERKKTQQFQGAQKQVQEAMAPQFEAAGDVKMQTEDTTGLGLRTPDMRAQMLTDPGAKTQEQITQRVQGVPMSQLKQVPEFATAPTEMQMQQTGLEQQKEQRFQQQADEQRKKSLRQASDDSWRKYLEQQKFKLNQEKELGRQQTEVRKLLNTDLKLLRESLEDAKDELKEAKTTASFNKKEGMASGDENRNVAEIQGQIDNLNQRIADMKNALRMSFVEQHKGKTVKFEGGATAPTSIVEPDGGGLGGSSVNQAMERERAILKSSGRYTDEQIDSFLQTKYGTGL